HNTDGPAHARGRALGFAHRHARPGRQCQAYSRFSRGSRRCRKLDAGTAPAAAGEDTSFAEGPPARQASAGQTIDTVNSRLAISRNYTARDQILKMCKYG